MCLILFAYKVHPHYPLILVANRDEFYHRPTAPLAFWADAPEVLAGRDLQEQGTWMGVTRRGKLAALTNYRDPHAVIAKAPSRGLLVGRYLTRNDSAAEYARLLRQTANEYNGYSLLFGDFKELFYFCNRARAPQRIQPGLYGLSNRFLDTPWPKVREGKAALECVVVDNRIIDPQACFDILSDRTLPPVDQLPDTGVGLHWERILSPRFIAIPDYGTRSSTVLLCEKSGRVQMIERTFVSKGKPGPLDPQIFQTCAFEFYL